MNFLIVEDEPLAASLLEDYIRQTPNLTLAGKCTDAIQAIDALRQHQVDVMLLDIHLPGIRGLDFLRTLDHRPQVILTTAYQEYAVEGFEIGVADYLVKPIEYARFLKSLTRLKFPSAAKDTQTTRQFYFFHVNRKMIRVWLDEIQVVESMREYVVLYLITGEKIMTKMTTGNMENLLHGCNFMRVHRSFIVAVKHLLAFDSHELNFKGITVPIGRVYKDAVVKTLDNSHKEEM